MYRILSTKSLLTLPESSKLLGNLSSASSPYTSSAEAIVDAIAQRFATTVSVDILELEDGIVEQKGDPLSQGCRILIDCSGGEGLVRQNAKLVCAPCSEGNFSPGGTAAKCEPCPPGKDIDTCVCVCVCVRVRVCVCVRACVCVCPPCHLYIS